MLAVVPDDSSDTDATMPQQSRYIHLVTHMPAYFSALSAISPDNKLWIEGFKKKYVLRSAFISADGVISPELHRAHTAVSLHVAEAGRTLTAVPWLF